MYRDLIKDVFFDLDHTLWDFERNSALTFETIFEQRQMDIDLPAFLEVYVPANIRYWKMYREERISKENLRYERLKSVFDTLGITVPDGTINQLAADYIAQLSTYGHLFPHATEVLNYLRPKYRLHIITNGFQEIQAKKLKNSGIDMYFEHVIDAEVAGAKKPHPRIFEMALERSRAVPQRSLMIGDSLEADILGAKALGMHALHFNAHGEPGHDHAIMIRELKEIKRYL
ncbi:YjjG family noncanonical pyrimidine nucleotidase [Maribacter sp. 2307ULW6-5]|uniref:YjjG family noncanonical pyrimidine nucleotidase n=1 Tax=Maribacter sp. 2307ULW6-5 TaxID=3386275 RepID=UPI0039BD09FA